MANLVAAFTSSGSLRGRKRAAAATSSLVERPRKRWRSFSGAVTMKLWSWFAAWLRAFTADWRADLKVRIISARPSPLLGSPAAWPASTVRAAVSASMGSDLPRRRRWRRLGLSTSMTAMPAAFACAPHGAEALRPTDDPFVALGSGWHLCLVQAPSQSVQHHRHVKVEVSVHSQHHLVSGHIPRYTRRSSSLVPLLPVSSPTAARYDAESGRHCEGPRDAAGKLLLGHATPVSSWAVAGGALERPTGHSESTIRPANRWVRPIPDAACNLP